MGAVRMSAADPVKPTPPPFPAKGTPAYEARLAAMRAGHAKRLEKAKKAQQRPQAPPIAEADLIDVGDPKAVRMAPEPRPDPKGGKSKSGGGKGKGEFDEAEVHRHIKLGLDMLAQMPGRGHWQTDDDEVELIAGPATRCLNRLDPKLLRRMREVSDPVALVFACVMVLGPRIVQEVQNVRPMAKGNRQPPMRADRREQPQRPAGEVDEGPGGYSFADTAAVSRNGAQPIAPPDDIPSVGI